jgi:hypothetical protein
MSRVTEAGMGGAGPALTETMSAKAGPLHFTDEGTSGYTDTLGSVGGAATVVAPHPRDSVAISAGSPMQRYDDGTCGREVKAERMRHLGHTDPCHP